MHPPASASKAQGLQAQATTALTGHCLPLHAKPLACAQVQNTVGLLGFEELCLSLLFVLGPFTYLFFGCIMCSSTKI